MKFEIGNGCLIAKWNNFLNYTHSLDKKLWFSESYVDFQNHLQKQLFTNIGQKISENDQEIVRTEVNLWKYL